MALIITKMETALRIKFPRADIAMSSYMDDLRGGIYIWDAGAAKGCNMEEMLQRAHVTVNRVAAENHLSLKNSKHERLVLRDDARGMRR